MTDLPASDLTAQPEVTQTPLSPTPTTEPTLLGESPAPEAHAPAPFVPLTDEEVAGLFADAPPEALKKVSETFSELKLDKAGAEKLSALYGSMRQEAEQATATAWNDTIKSWQEQSRAHPDFGGEKFDTSLAQAKQIVTDYGDKGFQEMLAVTGVGNHPAMISFILKLAKAIPGDAAPVPVNPTAPARDLASILFPSHGAN